MLKNIKIGKRLIIAFTIVALVVSIAGILGIYLFSKTDTDYSHALQNYGFASGELGMLSSEINNNRAYIRDIVFLEEKEQLDNAYNEIQASIQTVNTLMEEVRLTNTSDAAQTLFATIEEDIGNYRTVRDQVIEYGMANQREKAYTLWIEDASPKITKISDDIDTLYQMNLEAGQTVSAQLTSFGRIMLIVMIACIAVGYVIAAVFAIYISRGISKPLMEIEQISKKMSAGDYDVQINYCSKDEVGSLADSMRKMVKTTKEIILDTSRGLHEIAGGNFNVTPQVEYIGVFKGIEDALSTIITDLSDTMSQIVISAEQVSCSSDQVSSSAQALAQGSTEQASSVEELSASINEVSDQIKSNASNASSASNVVIGVGENIQTCNTQMTEMMNAMDQISNSSAQIGRIIKTIEDIAFQTNILALNAAVEAARAGSAGKGFAVVADEVRNLATKSSDAAKQTNALIEDSVTRVENGVKIADETAKSLVEVVEGANEITSLITKISEASAEQAASIAQINLGVEQISSVVQTNSATSEQSAAASEELNGQANMMKEMVSKFNLKSNISQ